MCMRKALRRTPLTLNQMVFNGGLSVAADLGRRDCGLVIEGVA